MHRGRTGYFGAYQWLHSIVRGRHVDEILGAIKDTYVNRFTDLNVRVARATVLADWRSTPESLWQAAALELCAGAPLSRRHKSLIIKAATLAMHLLHLGSVSFSVTTLQSSHLRTERSQIFLVASPT